MMRSQFQWVRRWLACKVACYPLFFSPIFLLTADIKKEEAQLSTPKAELPEMLVRYLSLFKEKGEIFGPLGKWQNAEIEIITNPDQIHKIQNQMRLRLIGNGYAESDAETWSRVGIIAEDSYWLWIRDAVIFPSGVPGTYDRLMWKSGLDGPPAVAILPLLSTKKVVVNVHYRHATRSWELELPRGRRKTGESWEKAAMRELREETGYHTSKCTYLATLTPDTGILMSELPLYCVEANHSGESNKEYSEAIVQNPAFTKEELKQGFAKGYMDVLIKGNIVKVKCRDPLLAFAILQAEMKGYL